MRDQEAIEMSRSQSSSTDVAENVDEEAQLLSKDSDSESEEELDEDEEWAIVEQESGAATEGEGQGDSHLTVDSPIVRFIVMLCSIGVMFVVFKLLMLKFAKDPELRDRQLDKTYNNGTDNFETTVIVISIDGFRPDYLNRGLTPHLQNLGDSGVIAKYMHPAFPPNTFPNHWTLATGLYPEAHGIVANLFYDPSLNDTFQATKKESSSNPKWWKGEPIWATAKKNKMRTGSIMWPGSETSYHPPDHVVNYNGTMRPIEKIKIITDWLDLPSDKRPQLITMYIPQIDMQGHQGGPFGSQMNNLIKETDDSIGYLATQLKERNLESHVHIVVVSDHGMTEVSDKKVIYYDEIVSPALLQHVQSREAFPLLDLRPNPNAPKNTTQALYHQLVNYTQSVSDPHFQVYLRDQVPARFHYSNSERITPVVAIPDPGYTFATREEILKYGFKQGGNHGYDNLAEEMRAIFIASGPKVQHYYRPGTILVPFFNIEVYRFLSDLLNIDAAPNNGTMEGDFPPIYIPPF